MGFGMGAAIGAALATGKRVVLVTGDGSFRMNAMELATAASLGLPITVLLMNNTTLGMVRQQQKHLSRETVWATDLCQTVDACALARSLGAKTYRARGRISLERALQAARNILGPSLIDVQISAEETVREVRL